MNIPVEELKEFNGGCEWCKNQEGYRIIYFYSDSSYYIGAATKTVEAFMINFCDIYPIEDESDIPKFIFINDLLDRYLNRLNDVTAVALYKTDGTCICKKERTASIESKNYKV